MANESTNNAPVESPAGRLFLGCAIWAYPGWVGDFYPRRTKSGEMLDLYVKRLNAVEGNTTFYAIPPEPTVERWARQMPESFRFCPKLPKALTHHGKLVPSIGGARDFLSRLAPLAKRIGLVFAQLPATYGPDQAGDLFSFVESWPHERAPLGIELRHPRWFDDEPRERLVRALKGAGVANVILDTRPIFEGKDNPQANSKRKKPRLPVRADATAPACMVRYIGHPEIERDLPHLERWAELTARWLREGHDVFFFCHCPMEEVSPHLARIFHGMLEARLPSVAPLPWSALPRDSEQLELF